jgi:hypothetical protein
MRRLVLVAAFLACVSGNARAAPAENETTPWLLVADVHFDPFAEPSAVDKLAATPPEKWPEILAAGRASFPAYGSDTNFTLLRASLAGMRQAVPSPRVVLIAGDFLAHDFRGHFEHDASDHTRVAFEAFVDKTIRFLALQFQSNFPEAQFILAVGNNDSYCGDYASTPGSAFLAHTEEAWAPLVERNGAAPDFAKSFPASGHFVTDVAGTSVRVLIANSVYWARKFNDPCGPPGEHPGDDELQWLKAELDATPAGETNWILTHLPPGMDSFASAKSGEPTSFYAPKYLEAVIPVIERGARVNAVVAGHTHGLSLRFARDPTQPQGAAMLLLPSITPIFKNNPGFVVAQVSSTRGQIVDFTAWGLDLKAAPSQASWRADYVFSSAAGSTPVNATTLAGLEQKIAKDPASRARFESAYVSDGPNPAVTEKNWRVFWCSIESMSATAYQSCMAAH